jgi:hypothetical protein
MTAHELERAIRAKVLDGFTPHLQRDLDRMARDLRQQGASEESIRDQLVAVVEMQQQGLLEAARKVTADVVASGFLE